jgi:cation diffusion facilitator CzcD-associated flavoprotein CzcO
LQQAGLDYEVVDQAPVLASTWASLYPSLRLNTTRFFSHMPGEKFPLHYGLFPTGRQYHAYLVKFVQKHRLKITLGIEVQRVTPDAGGWRVESSRGCEWYAVVVVATGRFGNPYRPPLPGLARFTGQVLHARDYHGPQPFAGQRVMVLGNGPTGVDLAVDLPRAAALPVYLAMRTGLVLRPRYPYGLPKHMWMMLAEALPPPLGTWLEKKALAARYRRLEQVGIKVPVPGQESGAAGTRGPELIHAVQRGQVKPVDAPVDFDGQDVILPDGRRVTIDALLLATGYRPVLDFLDIDYETDTDGLPLREARDFPVDRTYAPHTGYEVKGYPGLFVTGIFYQGKGAMYNFNLEGAMVAQQVAQRLRVIEMLRDEQHAMSHERE